MKKLLASFFEACQGRHTAFAVSFAVMGTVMAWFHRLDMSYIALIGVIQGWVFAHSYQENKFAAETKMVTATTATTESPATTATTTRETVTAPAAAVKGD